MDFNELNHLREAVKNSPDNVPLRKFLANALIKNNQYEEAEIEYKAALKLAPQDNELKLGLAEAFAGQEKTSLGLVLIEELTALPTPPTKTWLVYARLLLQTKDARGAKEAYDNALAIDANLADSFLES
ncbi:MAG: tetratricopeptide repeat protein, partial [Bacteroidota bacterium]